MVVRLALIMTLFSASVCLGAEPAVRVPAGVRLVQDSRGLRGERHLAKLGCSLYEIAVEKGRLGKSRLLKREESAPFAMGQQVIFKVDYPAPYEGVSVAFNHFFVGYLESPEQKPLPYVQAFYMQENSPVKDAQFDLGKMGAGDRVMLRDVYGFSPEALLTFQCGLELL